MNAPKPRRAPAPPWDSQREDGTDGSACLVPRIVGRIELSEGRGDVIKSPRDIELPLRVVNRRRVRGFEVWDVVDAAGRLCMSGRTEDVTKFVDKWGR